VTKTKTTYLLAFLFGALLLTVAAAPVPTSKTQALDTLEERKEQEKEKTATLEKKMKSLNRDLEKTKAQLVKKAEAVQSHESMLKELEDRIADLEAQQKEIKTKIDHDKASIGKMIIALQRIRRMPPEAIIASPDAPIQTARSSYLIGKIVPSLNKRAQELADNMETLRQNREELQDKRERAYKRSEDLNAEYKTLSSLMQEREALYQSIQGDLRSREEKLQRIARQASNLKDLVDKIEVDKRRERTRQAAYNAVKQMENTARPPPSSSTSRGGAQLPVSGIVRIRYGDPDKFGAKSQGIKIESRTGALVVSPMGGTVRYTGQFKNYGNIIIIEHDNGYHSLLAGLKKIDTVVGRSVTTGEPVGILSKGSDGGKAMLYYELRFKGSAVNPAKKLTGLG